MAQLNVAELDFDTIKQNLKSFLQSQEEFQDYNFEGSALSILLDILAYNTHYNATLAHLQANEMFIDSAVKRNSVTSIAKTLGYTPTSIRSARANITLEVKPSSSFSGTSLTLTRDTPFVARTAQTAYNFFPKEDYFSTLVFLENGDLGFRFDAELIEGVRISNTFVADLSNLSGPFVLPNRNIDTSTIRVRVQESATVVATTTWNFYDDIMDIDSTTRAFFVEEGPSGLTEIRFGDDVLGRKLSVGNIVVIDYIVSNGSAANSIPNFATTNTFTGSGETKRVFLNYAATGGADPESVDSIRYNAPKFNATKNRVVTSSDYGSLIRSRFSNINSIAVWGGEENVPPIYGKVFISIQPIPGSIITQADRDAIVRDIIRPRSVVSIQPEFVSPLETYIGLNITADYNKSITSLTSSRIESEIKTVVLNFFINNLNKLQKNFYYSKLLSSVIATTQSVFSASIQVNLHKRIPVFLDAPDIYQVRFNTPLEERKVRSTNFTVNINGKSYTGYVTDDHDRSPGILVLRGEEDQIIQSNVGTVDYNTGEIILNDIDITSLAGGESDLRIYVEPAGDAPNILTTDLTSTTPVSTGPVFPFSARNTVLTLDSSPPNPAANIPPGLIITAIANLQE